MFNIFSKEGLALFLFTLPALLLSLSIHEFAHAYTAYKLGDMSQKYRGRLTLDPFKHIDIVGFLCIMLCGFGWGKPVQIVDTNFKNRAKGNAIVAFAGPFSNILLAIFFAIVIKILSMTGVLGLMATNNIGIILIQMLSVTIYFNIVFAVFNMLPIPPFDGSKVLFYFLPRKYKNIMYTLEKYSLIILLVLIITNVHYYIVGPIVNFLHYLLILFINL